MRYFIILIFIPFIQLTVSALGQEFLPAPHSFTVKYTIYFLQQFFAVFVPTYFLFKKESYLNKEECNPQKISNIFSCVMCGIALQFLGIFVNLPFSVMLQKMGFTPPSSLPAAKSLFQFAVQTVAICLTPAIFEEVLFRRMIFNSIRKKSALAAILFSALFFAMAHFDFFNFPATFCIGLCLGIMRYRGTPLILCIITHFSVNFCATVLNIALQHPAISDFLMRYLLLFVFLFLALLVALFPKKQTKETLTDAALKRFGNYAVNLLKNPLFYGYIILFAFLGVRSL